MIYGTQLHSLRLGSFLSKELHFNLETVLGLNKPQRAFWTSTHTPDNSEESAWLEWCAAKSFGEWGKNYVAQPHDDARIYHVDSVGAFLRLPQQAMRGLTMLNYEEIARSYDAVHLCAEAVDVVRFPYLYTDVPHGTGDLYAWDCESTVWLRKTFTITGELE